MYMYMYLFIYLSLLILKQPVIDKFQEGGNLTMWNNFICHNHPLAQWTCA